MILPKAVRGVLAQIDGMPQRERWSVLAAVLALLVGVELMVVVPMHNKRLALADMASLALQEDERQKLAEVEAQRLQEEALSERLKAANDALRAMGVNADLVGTRGESLSFLLSSTLRDSAVQVVSLRAMEAEAMSLARPADESADSQTPRVLFRHRYVLTLSGEVDSVTQALEQLQDSLKPLRLERLKLQGKPDGSVLATIHWATIGLEKSWLSL